MRISRLYIPQQLIEGQQLHLNNNSSHYLATVLRAKQGQSLLLFNGDGYDYVCTLLCAEKKGCIVEVHTRQNAVAESPLEIHLGIGISKGDRLDWILQKSTELGVSEITPLRSARTEFKLQGDRLNKKVQHWQNIVISACEQSGRAVVPTLHPPSLYCDWIGQQQADFRFVLHHRNTASLPAGEKPSRIVLLIGPEGGLSEQEIALAQQQRYHCLSLGPRVLRTETAPLAAISIIQHRWGDMAG